MKLMQRIAVGVSCTLLVMLSIDLVAPRVVHAVAAALVQVTNTASNPVPTLNANYATAYVANCGNIAVPNETFNGCQISVPAGKRFMIQTVSMIEDFDSGVVVTDNEMLTDLQNEFYMQPLRTNTDSTTPFPFNQSNVIQDLHAFADSFVNCRVDYNTGTRDDILNCTVSGYLVDKP
jgi:hypothetical protein